MMRINALASILRRMRADLVLPPLVGEERLGVAIARYASAYNQTVIIIVEYQELPREAYVDRLGAPVSFDTRWLMRAAEAAAKRNAGVFLAHLHDHRGKPWFSPVDMRTNRQVIRPLALIDQSLPTGALLLSRDNAAALLGRSDGLIAIPVHEMVG